MIQPVDSLPDRQSPYGVLHMAGNVWEWTVTLYPETEKQIQEARDVARGRAMSPQWFSIKGGKFPADAFDFYRLFMRRGFPRDWRSDWIGFRCIKYA